MDSNEKKDENNPNVPPEKTAEVNPEDTKIETTEKKEGKKKCCKGENRCGRGMGPCEDPWNMPPGMRRMCPWGSFPMQRPFMPPMQPEDYDEEQVEENDEENDDYDDYDNYDYCFDQCKRRKCSKSPCSDDDKRKCFKPCDDKCKRKKMKGPCGPWGMPPCGMKGWPMFKPECWGMPPKKCDMEGMKCGKRGFPPMWGMPPCKPKCRPPCPPMWGMPPCKDMWGMKKKM